MKKLWRFGGNFPYGVAVLRYDLPMIYTFDEFELDLARAELRRAGEPCSVEPQVFALIVLLVEHRDRLVTRDEILDEIWGSRVVTDSALTSRIKSARKALGDSGKAQRYIRTVHGKGLRFVADVQARAGTTAKALATTPQGSGETTDLPTPSVDSRPSIAVLPFRTLGGEDLHLIADGLPHELITSLARLRWLFVVARGSSFRLRGDDIEPRRVGETLGVRYCLSGTVEINRERLSVTTELADTKSGDVVWAERYNGTLDAVHDMREQICASVLGHLEIQIPQHEATLARLIVPEDLDAWSAYHLALRHLYSFQPSDTAIAAQMFDRALKLDPGFARAHAGMSYVHFQTAFLDRGGNFKDKVELARRCAQQGVDLDPLDPFVNFTMGRTFWLDADLDRAYGWLERATSLCPNYAQGLYAKAWTESMTGAALEARGNLDLSMRLSPLDPLYYAMLSARGITHIALEEDQQAADWADRGARAPGAHALIGLIAAIAHQLAGNEERAQEWAVEVRQRMPEASSAVFFHTFPFRNPRQRKRMEDALTRLGF